MSSVVLPALRAYSMNKTNYLRCGLSIHAYFLSFFLDEIWCLTLNLFNYVNVGSTNINRPISNSRLNEWTRVHTIQLLYLKLTIISTSLFSSMSWVNDNVLCITSSWKLYVTKALRHTFEVCITHKRHHHAACHDSKVLSTDVVLA